MKVKVKMKVKENLVRTDLNQKDPCKEPEAKPGFASGPSSYFRKLLQSSKKNTIYKIGVLQH